MAEIDVGELREVINDKMDRDLGNKTVNISYIIESWSSGTSWYRIWSDGWCEQGGEISVPNTNAWTTVTLFKTMKDINYSIQGTVLSNDAYWLNQQPMYIGNKTQTTFTTRCNQNTSSLMWQVKGFLAEGQY